MDAEEETMILIDMMQLVGHLPQLPLTSMLWHCCTFLLTSLSSFADSRSRQAVSFLLFYFNLGADHVIFYRIFNFTNLILMNLNLPRQTTKVIFSAYYCNSSLGFNPNLAISLIHELYQWSTKL